MTRAEFVAELQSRTNYVGFLETEMVNYNNRIELQLVSVSGCHIWIHGPTYEAVLAELPECKPDHTVCAAAIGPE